MQTEPTPLAVDAPPAGGPDSQAPAQRRTLSPLARRVLRVLHGDKYLSHAHDPEPDEPEDPTPRTR